MWESLKALCAKGFRKILGCRHKTEKLYLLKKIKKDSRRFKMQIKRLEMQKANVLKSYNNSKKKHQSKIKKKDLVQPWMSILEELQT